MWIERQISKQIQLLANSRPCVLLTGARQTGKSSLLTRLFPGHSYISLDLPTYASEARENGAYFLEKNGVPIIIDKIQYAPELFTYLKVLIDQKRQTYGRFILTGSQKFSLMKGVSESLSGRVSILECHSLSIDEVIENASELTTQKILRWMIQGGHPELHARDLAPQRFYADYLATYLERDVRQLLSVKDLTSFDRFLRILALQSGRVLSMSNIATQVGISSHTVKSWISILGGQQHHFPFKTFLQKLWQKTDKVSEALLFGYWASLLSRRYP